MDYEKAQLALHGGQLVEAVITPAQDADGWVILLVDPQGDRVLYTGRSGTEKAYHTLDRATQVAREIGFETVRIEETF
jgi:hypothetical protein